MPVYLRKDPMEIPDPSESNWTKDDDENDYLTDPDQARDRLPQPYRMIDKMVSLLFDQAWEIIHVKEEKREAERTRVKAELYEPSAEIEVSGKVNCIAGGGAGNCVFVGLSVGVAVFSLPDCSWICQWDTASVDICTICAVDLGNQIHVLATVDDMGIARLFYFYKDALFLIKAVNETEDVSKRTICTNIDICQGGDYAGVLLEGGGESWLELYRLPKDSWLKEMGHSKSIPGIGSASAAAAPPMTLGTLTEPQTLPGTQDAEASEMVIPVLITEDIKLASPQLIMKIRPPRPIAGSSFKNLLDAVQKSDDYSVIGSGQNHVITAHQWEQQEAIFCREFRRYLEVDTPDMRQDEKPRRGVFHFHMPCKVLQAGGDSKYYTGSTNSISVHWSGYQNLCLYLIARTSKTDVDPKPDVVWPCAAPIACSAVSYGSAYLALGFEDGCITIWDMAFSGFPLAVLALPGENFLQSIYFLESPRAVGDQPQEDSAPVSPRAQILVWCTDGSLYLVTAAVGRETSTVLAHRLDSDDRLSAVMPVSSLPGTALLIFRTGVVQLLNCSERETIGEFAASPGYALASPWQPVFTVDQENACLIFRGDQRLSPGEDESREAASCSLFVFSLNSYPFMESLQKEQELAAPPAQLLPLEKRCQMFLQSRLQSIAERTIKQQECWEALPKHALEVHKINKGRRKTLICKALTSR